VKIFLILLLSFISISLTSCSNLTKQDVGTLSGGVVGGVIGSQFGGGSGKLVAIGLGTLAGALVGGSVGKSMDQVDQMKTQSALETQAVGQPAYWTNNKTGANYTVTPTRNVEVKGNPYCREYRTTAIISGKTQTVYGTACRQRDGSWKIVS